MKANLPHNFGVFIAVLCLVLTSSVHAQYWMQKGGGSALDEGYSIAVDGSGNTYSTGYFSSNATFGTTSFSSSGATDIYVVKTNNTGVVQWAVKAGGSGADRAHSIAIDGSGNSYITGYYSGTATFGTTSLVSEGLQDVFVAKYSSSGVLQWAVSAGGSLADIGNGIDVDNSGNSYIAGEFKGEADFGSTTLTSQGGSIDAFLMKVNSSGSIQWVEHGAGSHANKAVDVACDGSGNSYTLGTFSDTITFDNVHNNTMLNVAFLVKYNASGAEQWFKIIGGGASVQPTAIDYTAAGVYVTGDFTGNLTFYNSPNTVLTNSYDEGVFVAKYAAAGSTTWASASGSDSPIHSRDIAVDGSGNAYIIGDFECALGEYSDNYGEATFNSVGYSDIFTAKFTSAGAWSFGRNLGSRKDDFGRGIDVSSSGSIHFTGSFQPKLFVPVSSNFSSSNLSNWTQVSCAGNSPYCGDSDYGNFYRMNATGSGDIVIANCIDPNREPYDFYMRSGSGCNRDYIEPCIDTNCADTITNCQSVSMQVYPYICPQIGPELKYLWSTNTNPQFPTSATVTQGYEYVDVQSKDGCFVQRDSVYANVLPGPDNPHIEDDKVNFEPTPVPFVIEMCEGDTVNLLGSHLQGLTDYWWESATMTNNVYDTALTVWWEGDFSFVLRDSNDCERSTQIQILVFDSMPDMNLLIAAPDTVSICQNDTFYIFVYDSIGNPQADTNCLDNMGFYFFTEWEVTSGTALLGQVSCNTVVSVIAPDTGWITVEVDVARWIPCDTDSVHLTVDIYIEPLPTPYVAPYTVNMLGSSYFCPGDSCIQYASGGGTYTWYGPGNNNATTDSIFAWQNGWYYLHSFIADTGANGCVGFYQTDTMKYIQVKPQPVISASSVLICPGDSVLIETALNSFVPGSTFEWFGPNGPIAADTSAILVIEPGTYYVVVNDADSCDLTSNSVDLILYTTPTLSAPGNLVLCDGDSVEIQVNATSGAVIEWLPPLSGTGGSQVIYSPGTYSCQITLCDITTTATIEVLASEVEAVISPLGVLCKDSFMLIVGSDSMHTYSWSHTGNVNDTVLVSEPGTYYLTTTDTNGCEAISDPLVVGIDQDSTIISITGYPVLCEGDTMELFGNSNMIYYRWSTGDTTSSTLVIDDGLYVLTTKDSNGCRGVSEPIKITTPDTVAKFRIEGDLDFCEGDSVNFRANKKGMDTYLWLADSLEGRSITVKESGSFYLFTVDTFGCEAYSESVDIYMQPNLIDKPLVRDTTICQGTEAVLVAQLNTGELKWSKRYLGNIIDTGLVYETPTLVENQSYYIWGEHLLCTGDSAEVVVTVKDCYNALVPNIFSPNGDGYNDVFGVTLEEVTCFNCYIYNRWGVLIHELHGVEDTWDGTIQSSGEPAVEGTYYYILDYCRFNGSKGNAQSYVTLLRD